MTYDLRRLRLKGLIHRIPKTHRYTATSYGLKVAFFYAKLSAESKGCGVAFAPMSHRYDRYVTVMAHMTLTRCS